jgi:hypothetical protein
MSISSISNGTTCAVCAGKEAGVTADAIREEYKFWFGGDSKVAARATAGSRCKHRIQYLRKKCDTIMCMPFGHDWKVCDSAPKIRKVDLMAERQAIQL